MISREEAAATAATLYDELVGLHDLLDPSGVQIVSAFIKDSQYREGLSMVLVVRKRGIDGDRELTFNPEGRHSDGQELSRSVFQWFLEWEPERFERLPVHIRR